MLERASMNLMRYIGVATWETKYRRKREQIIVLVHVACRPLAWWYPTLCNWGIRDHKNELATFYNVYSLTAKIRLTTQWVQQVIYKRHAILQMCGWSFLMDVKLETLSQRYQFSVLECFQADFPLNRVSDQQTSSDIHHYSKYYLMLHPKISRDVWLKY